jgi:tetratricopeptide (TPR) repeat protein
MQQTPLHPQQVAACVATVKSTPISPIRSNTATPPTSIRINAATTLCNAVSHTLSPSSHALTAEAYCLAGQWQEAVTCFKALLANTTTPSNTVLKRAVEIAQKATALTEAFTWQKQLAYAMPFDAAAWLKLAQLAEDTEQLELAKHYYQRCLKRNNQQLEAWFGLGVVSEKQEEFETAKLYYEALLAINPLWLPALNNLAGCCMQLGCYEEAQEGFRQVLALMPQYPKALLGMGITLDFSGQHRAAGVYYGQYLRVRPTSSHSAFVRERLNELEIQRFSATR